MHNILAQCTMHGTYIKIVKYVLEKIYIYNFVCGTKINIEFVLFIVVG